MIEHKIEHLGDDLVVRSTAHGLRTTIVIEPSLDEDCPVIRVAVLKSSGEPALSVEVRP